MLKLPYWKKYGKGWEKKVIKKFRGRGVSQKALDKWLPDYIPGKEISALFEGKLNEFMYAKLGPKVEKFVKQNLGKNKFVSEPAWKVTMTYPDQPGRTHDQWVKAKSAKEAIKISKSMWSKQGIKVNKAIFDDGHWLKVQKAQKTGLTEGKLKE